MSTSNSPEEPHRELTLFEVFLAVAFPAFILGGILFAVSKVPVLARVVEFGMAILALFALMTFLLRSLAFRTFGLPSRHTFAKIWELETANRHGLFGERSLTARQRVNPVLLPSVLCLAGAGMAYASHERFFDVATGYFLIHVVVAHFAVHIPPSVVFLASSGALATEAHKAISGASGGCFRVASLLNHQEGHRNPLTPPGRSNVVLQNGNLRTVDTSDWRETVTQLLRLSPVIVVDLRSPGDALSFEIDLLGRLGLDDKTYFLVSDHEGERQGQVSRVPPLTKLDHVMDVTAFTALIRRSLLSPGALPTACQFR